MRVRFWGTRGSIVAPGSRFLRYGGNTPCVEVSLGDKLLVLDAGIGLTQLYSAHARRKRFEIVLTHTHWDHIQALPYFPPMFFSNRRIVIRAAEVNPRYLAGIVARQFSDNYSPFHSIRDLASMLDFRRLRRRGQTIEGFRVTACPVTHSANACAIRVQRKGRSVVYVSDHEGGVDPERDAALADFARGTDLLIHDAQFMPEEYAVRRGWGHSSWVEAVKAGAASGARRLALFHHHYNHEDDVVDRIHRQAAALSDSLGGPPVNAAREGMTIEL